MEQLEAVTYDASTGRFVAVARLGKAYYSLNSGTTWSAGATGISDDVRAVASNSIGVLIAVRNNDRVLRSTDGGATWTPGSTGAGIVMFSVAAR